MLPSLQESLDGDEKELESSEEGGPVEERRLEPPPSSHYCLYIFRGSRCLRPARCARGPAARPCTPWSPLAISSPSQGLWPDGPSWPQSVLPGSSGFLCPALPSFYPLAAPVIAAPDICSSEFFKAWFLQSLSLVLCSCPQLPSFLPHILTPAL